MSGDEKRMHTFTQATHQKLCIPFHLRRCARYLKSCNIFAPLRGWSPNLFFPRFFRKFLLAPRGNKSSRWCSGRRCGVGRMDWGSRDISPPRSRRFLLSNWWCTGRRCGMGWGLPWRGRGRHLSPKPGSGNRNKSIKTMVYYTLDRKVSFFVTVIGRIKIIHPRGGIFRGVSY